MQPNTATKEKLIPLTEIHQELLEKRGINPEIATRLGWLSCAARKGDWIAIPFMRAGKVVNHKYRRINKIEGQQNFSQDKGGEQCFYNLPALEDIAKLSHSDQHQQTIVITEGEMDCAVALQCGYLAISVPSGAPAQEVSDGEGSVKYDFLKDLPRFGVIILATDDDPAGIALRRDMAVRIGWHRCKWIQYPRECKDLNQVYEKYGQKGMKKVLEEKAKFLNEGGVFKMSELPDIEEMPGCECGVANLSSMIKLRMGDFSVWTGIPSMGKSLLVNHIAYNMARDHDWKPCIATFEHSPKAEIRRELRTTYLGKSRLDGQGYDRWTTVEIAEADAWIDKNIVFIVPDDNSDDLITLKWFLSRARAAIIQEGVNMIIIDPWNELDHDRPPGMSLTEYTGYAIKELKRLARQYKVHVAVVAHPAKPEKNKNGQYNVPTMYDVSDSAHWYNKADIGVIVHRFEGDNGLGVLVRVAKVRIWNVMGRPGDKILEYLPEQGKYIDFPDFQPKRTPKTVAEKKREEKEKKKSDEFEKQGQLLADKED